MGAGRPRKLTPLEEMDIFSQLQQGEKRREQIALEYNVSVSTLTRINNKYKEMHTEE